MSSDFLRPAAAPIFTPSQGPGGVAPPDARMYEAMGQDNIKAMLRDVYLKLGASEIAPMFAEDLAAAADRSALFFIGLLGGPPLYAQTYGPPRMRARHFPFRITERYRAIWLGCFFAVLDDYPKYRIPAEYVPGFRAFLDGFSRWMVNAEDVGVSR